MAEPIITAYTLFGLPPEHPGAHHFSIQIERASFKSDSWAIRNVGWCLSRGGKWDDEPSPSSRTDAWLRRHRFSLDEAVRLAKKALPKIVVNGLTAAEVMEKYPLKG